METYAFTDIGLKHFMVLGPAGTSWMPIPGAIWYQGNQPRWGRVEEDAHAAELDDIFRVQGYANAVSFAAWMRNEHDSHIKPVELCHCCASD
jgi:hypothetical protein